MHTGRQPQSYSDADAPPWMAPLAAALVLLDSLRAERDSSLASLCASSRGLRLHSGLDLARHGQKGLLDIRRRLGRRFQKLNAERVGKFLALLRRNDTLGRQIALVANQQLVDILCRIAVNLMQPLLDIVERFRVRHVVNDNNSC